MVDMLSHESMLSQAKNIISINYDSNIEPEVSNDIFYLFESGQISRFDFFQLYLADIEKYESQYPLNKKYNVLFTQEGQQLILRVIETETHGADFDSRCNVASVVLNRLFCDDFPNEITKVIKAKGQFSYKRKKISPESEMALQYVLTFGTTTDAIAFHSNKKKDKFFGYDYLFTDQAGHNFYGRKEN